jgi:hypothetical protein
MASFHSSLQGQAVNVRVKTKQIFIRLIYIYYKFFFFSRQPEEMATLILKKKMKTCSINSSSAKNATTLV